MQLLQFAYFFINDDGLRIHQIQPMLQTYEYQAIENQLRQGMPDYADEDIASGAMQYIANPAYTPKFEDIAMLEGISNAELVDYLRRLAKRCEQTTIPAKYRPAICNVIRVIHKMWFRSWYKAKKK